MRIDGTAYRVGGEGPLLTRAQATALAPPALPKASVLYDYTAQSADELTIHEGDVIEVVSTSVPDDPDNAWWMGRLNGTDGLVPKDYVALQ